MEKFLCSRLKGGPPPHPSILYKHHIMVNGNDVHETCRMVLKTTAHRQRSTVASGTTPSGCTQRAPTGNKNTRPGLACPSIKERSKQSNIVSIRPPPKQALDGGLGDYTQWVHSACPHWTRNYLVYWRRKHPSGCKIKTDRNSIGNELTIPLTRTLA